MAINNEVAYSYAKAIFSLAAQQSRLSEWATFLNCFAVIMQTKAATGYCSMPVRQPQKLLEDVFNDFEVTLIPEMINFIKLMLSKKRWSLVPIINGLYQEMFAEHVRLLRVKIITAEQLAEDEKQEIIERLAHCYDCTIELQQEVDVTLIGGAVLRIKDKVIDGSVVGQLQRLKAYL